MIGDHGRPARSAETEAARVTLDLGSKGQRHPCSSVACAAVLPAASFTLSECSYAEVLRLQREIGCSETVAWVLARRGVSVEQARHLLNEGEPTQADFHDPRLLGDMDAAVERIRYAIEHGEQIVVHGDYDADGVCSTALLAEALDVLGAEVRVFLPNRFRNGYGLQLDSVDRFALDGARLLITVDCGITAVQPIAQAIDRGMDVVVCDHHQPGEVLPAAIICSTKPSDYPFPELCATAVVGKLVQALGAPYGPEQHALEAIATVADCVPLVEENRALVRRGLAGLRRTTRPGLRSLIASCNLQPSQVSAEDIAFKIAPRINAAGRLADSDRAYELLRTTDQQLANTLARELHDANEERRRIERQIVTEAEAQIEGWDEQTRASRCYVVSGAGWHEGVVGIVAARLVERYHRPVVVIAELEPLARGSARSIEAFDMHAALAHCSDLLVRWGGHRAAGGVTLDARAIPELRARLAAWADDHLSAADLEPVERVDAVVAGDELSMALVEELDRLAPFGNGNERPRLLAVGAEIVDAQTVGADRRHLKCRVTTGGSTAPAIGFGLGEYAQTVTTSGRVDVCLKASINRFRGSESLQLEIDRLIPIPTHMPRIAGMCTVRCTHDCDQRIGLDGVLAAAHEPHPVASADPARPVPLEPLLGRVGTIDLRHANRALAHVARLATAGASQLVVCSDVSRRREVLTGALHPDRLRLAGAALASERCSQLGVQARLRRMAEADGPVLVFADYGALAHVLESPVRFDAVVVLDPPVVEQQRDLLLRASAPLHLVFGAADARFAYQVAQLVGDVRGTLGAAWKRLRSRVMEGEELERALFGEGAHLSSPSAVAHGLHELRRKGFVRIAGSRVQAVNDTATPEAGSAPERSAGSVG